MIPSFKKQGNNSDNKKEIQENGSQFDQTDDKSSSLNRTAKTKSYSEFKLNNNNSQLKITLPKNHRKIYESFKEMLTAYDKEDAFYIVDSILAEINDDEENYEDF